MDSLHALQQIELNILLDVDRFCKKHHITYFLGEGTLLGAIRHQGFIPWDDDIDLVMKRSDYDHFLDLAPTGLGEHYEVQHYSTVSNFWSPIIKVRLLTPNQPYHQQHIAHLTAHNGAYIDIFPMDYLPKQHSFLQQFQFTMIRLFRGMLSLKLGLFPPKSIMEHLIKWSSSCFSIVWIHRKLDRLFRQHGSKPTHYIATFSSYHPYRCLTLPSTVYDEQLFVPFEGHLLPVPKGYDLLLKTIYGNYQIPPPPQDRVATHYFDSSCG